MKLKDLHQLPKVRDSLSFLYLEHGKIDQHEKAIAVHDVEGMTPIPIASLAVLLLGPGTSITHAAISALADNSTLVIWAGEEGVRYYAHGMGGTRGSTYLLRQAALATDQAARLVVVRRMYAMRFQEEVRPGVNVEQMRGMEARRVRQVYADASKASGVEWSGRSYDRSDWHSGDTVNRALSSANSCLYGVCHAAILSVGLSPAIGFIHTGKQLSFVYDIADLYKTEITIPLAFAVAKEKPPEFERVTRLRCRDLFREQKLLQRVVPDVLKVLDIRQAATEAFGPDEDPALPTELWAPDERLDSGGETPDGRADN